MPAKYFKISKTVLIVGGSENVNAFTGAATAVTVIMIAIKIDKNFFFIKIPSIIASYT
jgi:hypothetical protein